MTFEIVRQRADKYTIKHFNAQFPDDASCLAHVFKERFFNGLTCAKCGRENMFSPVVGRRAYACPCGFQVYPTAGTIFHKSPTPLKTWFLAMFYMTASKNGVAALELQRHIGVTYKCAWRMCHQIRKLMSEEVAPLMGTVEVDETYVGGKRPGKRGRGAAGKTAVVGALERGGNVVPFVVENTDAATIIPLVQIAADPSAKIMTDEYRAYSTLRAAGFSHETICHGAEEWSRGNVHTNSIEGFWSQMKRSIDGTHHGVSKRYLQRYADEFAFRYNRRKSKTPMFSHLVSQLADSPF